MADIPPGSTFWIQAERRLLILLLVRLSLHIWKGETSSGIIWLPLGEGNGNPLQYSCLESPMDGGAWWAVVHGVARSRTQLSDFTFTFHFHALEKEMATHSSILAWRIPGTGEPGGLSSMGSHRVGHNWSDLAAAAAAAVRETAEASVLTFAAYSLRKQGERGPQWVWEQPVSICYIVPNSSFIV